MSATQLWGLGRPYTRQKGSNATEIIRVICCTLKGSLRPSSMTICCTEELTGLSRFSVLLFAQMSSTFPEAKW